MFTNWLTSPSATQTTSNQSIMSTNTQISLGQSLPANLMATPPDIILEVGPPPSVRFVAHSTLLALHSGYLRSAIRIDENNGNYQNSGVDETLSPIYLTNVTPEQFGPLLTFMYTGYLDLTLENIFGVLLATHVLHMPRALEICRTFLSRSQNENYLNSGIINHLAENNSSQNSSSSKIIRPIASKPIISNLGFIAPPMQHNISLPTTGTPFRSLLGSNASLLQTSYQLENLSPKSNESTAKSESSTSPIEPVKSVTPEHIIEIKDTKSSSKSRKRHSSSDSKRPTKIHQNEPSTSISQLPAQKSIHDSENKVIIDVASCDGPVRFRRVLNDAYGRQPDTVHLPIPAHERNQSMSYSFHQQMAKNISQRHQQHNVHSEESENSEDVKHGEIFNCVYCKHTFKSQYCYQKHAKRHLNPLSLDNGEGIILAPKATTFGELFFKKDEKSSTTSVSLRSTTPMTTNTISSGSRNETESKPVSSKREVRPLDMNVQYYPCKTCGSKFPSYYFVHKHRKLCHVNEEN